MLNRYIKHSLHFLAISLFIVFSTQILLRAWFLDVSDNDPSLVNDHFRNMVVAKNVVKGLGWSSSGYETYPLNPEVLTSGPTVILPASLAIYLFGNQINTPGVAIAIFNIFLFAAALILLRKLLDRERFYLFIILSIAFFEATSVHYWSYLIGEVSAVLLLLISLLILTQNHAEFSQKNIMASGFVAGLAILSKQLAMLSCIGISAGLFICVIFSKKYTLIKTLTMIFLFLASWVIPSIIFSLYKMYVFSSLDPVWVSAYHHYANKIFLTYSGVSSLMKYIDPSISLYEHFLNIFLYGFSVAVGFFYGSFLGEYSVYALFFICLITGGSAIIYFKKSPTVFLFYSGSIPLIAWLFLVADSSMSRYLYIGYSTISVVAIFCICTMHSNKLIAVLSLIFLLFVSLASSGISRSAAFSMPLKPSTLKESINQMDAYIKNSNKKIHWIGMRENAEFEYLSDVPNGFRNALVAIVDAVEFDEVAYLNRYPEVAQLVKIKKYKSGFDYFTDPSVTERHVAPVRIVKEIHFQWLHEKSSLLPMEKGVLCESIVFQNPHYLIEDCHTQDIANYFQAKGGLDYRPSPWLWPRSYPPEESPLFF